MRRRILTIHAPVPKLLRENPHVHHHGDRLEQLAPADVRELRTTTYAESSLLGGPACGTGGHYGEPHMSERLEAPRPDDFPDVDPQDTPERGT